MNSPTPLFKPKAVGARFRFEKQQIRKGLLVGGGDEAGRGPWAGPVVAALVILDPEKLDGRIHDSKQVRPELREHLFDWIREHALAWGIGEASPREIDEINILEATRLAFARAFGQLVLKPRVLLMDAITVSSIPVAQLPIIKGDAKSLSIAAASILAKVHRDRLMAACEKKYPGYGFAQHKGYGTAVHRGAMERMGLTPIHRLSYRPVAAVAAKGRR